MLRRRVQYRSTSRLVIPVAGDSMGLKRSLYCDERKATPESICVSPAAVVLINA